MVNRYSPAIWYRPQLSLIDLAATFALFRPSHVLEMLVTNIEQEAQGFPGPTCRERGARCSYHGPLTSDGPITF